jgi:hypothetical protein
MYRAVAVTRSCARIARGSNLEAEIFPGRAGPVRIKVHSEYDLVEGASLPRLLVIQAEGVTGSFGLAQRALIESALDVASILACASNATIDAPQLERAYDITPGAHHRDFYKNFGLHLSERERRVREVPLVEATSLFDAVAQHVDRDRIVRATRQYRLALTYWESGLETLALAHLYMGIEAIAEAALRRELSLRGMDEGTLAEEWQLPKEELGKRLHSNLVSHARRRIVFQGDEQTHKKARDASDGFEHGFKDVSDVDALSREVRTTTARYLRESILRVTLHEGPVLQVLLSPPLDFVLHAGPPTFELRAELLGDVEMLAPPGLDHPDVVFEALPIDVRRVEDGQFQVLHRGFGEWQLGDGVRADKMRIISESTPTSEDDPSTRPVRVDIVRLPHAE